MADGPLNIVVFGNKGGTGKSMLAEHMAVWLAEYDQDRAVMLTDLDARQGDSLLFAQRRAEAWPELPQIDALAPKDAEELRLMLQKAKKIGAHIVVDCPPADSQLAMEACKHADAILFPFRAGAHDIRALGRATEIARETYTPGRPPVVIGVVNFYDDRTMESRIALDALKERSDVFIFAGVIGQRTLFNKALMTHRAVWELSPTSPGAKEARSVCENVYQALTGGSSR